MVLSGCDELSEGEQNDEEEEEGEEKRAHQKPAL
jgi:hypothetical protein